ncbi:hypothetical protein SLEP1_g2503 [Rubroshorea leprosula]|uniref:(+)-neomenthol dehydrogenase-like n=1 Tax=Rubroshorea leprosula TaxID=152421 RepID=A0AAV5HR39_9ROSI|nr:hypothetical protein SLEP1_g2503 [Rubroshorea leprosula]
MFFLTLIQHIPSEWAKGVLSNDESLTEERIEEVLNEFLEDFRKNVLKAKGWPTYLGAPAYSVSKAAMNAYTRILAKRYPSFCVNCVAPGFVKTDISCNMGNLTPAEGAESAVQLALLPIGGPSGLLFNRKEVSCF